MNKPLKVLLKILNPGICILNYFSYCGHVSMQVELGRDNPNRTYEKYDFSRDIKYF